MVKVGDLFEITLSDNRKAIGHYVYWDDKNGPFIQVFNYLADQQEMRIEDALKNPYLFPPIITGLKAAVRNGLWPIIGKSLWLIFLTQTSSVPIGMIKQGG